MKIFPVLILGCLYFALGLEIPSLIAMSEFYAPLKCAKNVACINKHQFTFCFESEGSFYVQNKTYDCPNGFICRFNGNEPCDDINFPVENQNKPNLILINVNVHNNITTPIRKRIKKPLKEINDTYIVHNNDHKSVLLNETKVKDIRKDESEDVKWVPNQAPPCDLTNLGNSPVYDKNGFNCRSYYRCRKVRRHFMVKMFNCTQGMGYSLDLRTCVKMNDCPAKPLF